MAFSHINIFMIKKNRVLRIKNHEDRINWLKTSGQTVPEAQLTLQVHYSNGLLEYDGEEIVFTGNPVDKISYQYMNQIKEYLQSINAR
jgi:hypothetical protein